jgi:hypothetical protein
MLCSAGANGSHQEQQPVSVRRHDIEYLDGKHLLELLMASQKGTILILFSALEDIPNLMYTSNNCSQVS